MVGVIDLECVGCVPTTTDNSRQLTTSTRLQDDDSCVILDDTSNGLRARRSTSSQEDAVVVVSSSKQETGKRPAQEQDSMIPCEFCGVHFVVEEIISHQNVCMSSEVILVASPHLSAVESTNGSARSNSSLVQQTDREEALQELAKLEAEKVRLQSEREQLMAENQILKRRHQTVDSTLPASWILGPEKAFQLVILSLDSAEATDTILQWQKSGVQGVRIINIARIENRRLWQWYSMKKKDIADKNGGEANEYGKLWHGSDPRTIDTIVEHGFDHRVANMGGALGAGIYVATSSAYSHTYSMKGDVGLTTLQSLANMIQHRRKCSRGRGRAVAPVMYSAPQGPSTFTTPTATGHLKMLSCRALLGSVGGGAPGLRRPGPKPDGTLYDSVSSTGAITGGANFCIFDNNQVYPEFLITYARA